jgi:hypothetical protein
VPNSERIERAFKRKAKAAFKTASTAAPSDTNSAANRAYYCLYQALVGELERLGVRPQDIDAGASRAHKDNERLKWTHSFVRNNANLAGLDPEQCRVVRNAYRLRSIGDYEEENVESLLLNEILKNIPDILECLGINTRG